MDQGNRVADGKPAREVRLRDVTFAYPGGASQELFTIGRLGEVWVLGNLFDFHPAFARRHHHH